MTIELSEYDYNFLKELSHELNTQDNDGTADPVIWGVMEDKEVFVPENCGYPKITYDEGTWTLEEAVEEINQSIHEYDTEIQEEWKEVDKEDIYEVCDFMSEKLKWDYYDIVWAEMSEEINHIQGGLAFITKRACKDYIKRYGYNHSNPRPYGMCAYRNYELARLLNILKEIDFHE